MFVKQIDMIEALRLAAVGQEINIMAPNTSEPKRWADYSPDTLQNLLEGCLFFRKKRQILTVTGLILLSTSTELH